MEQRLILPQITSAGFYDTTTMKKATLPKESGRITTRFEWELPVQKEGVTCIDGVSSPIDGNQMLCFLPHQNRSVSLPYRCYYIHFTLSEGRLLDCISGLPSHVHISDPEKIANLFTDIIVARSFSHPENEILMYSKFLKLLYTLLEENNSFPSQSKKVNLTVSQTIRYLEQTKIPNPTLASIAEAVHVNPIYLQRIFKKATGVSPRQYLLNKRLNNAKNLLLIGKKSYAEIALMTGFSSQSYFNYIFKKEVGMTPSEYVSAYNNHT